MVDIIFYEKNGILAYMVYFVEIRKGCWVVP